MRYIGNKTKLMAHIEESIGKIDNAMTIADLFTGSGSVADYFKDKCNVVANDILYSSHIVVKAKISNASVPKFTNLGFDPFVLYSNLNIDELPGGFIYENYSAHAGRMYLSDENAKIIDFIRINIEELYDQDKITENEYYFLLASLIESVSKVSNVAGTYEAYLKKWDSRAIKKMKFIPVEMNHTEVIYKNEVYNEDINNVIRKISGDVLYLDPPYTTTEYSSAYHLLETIARYDLPIIKGVTGRRVNRQFSKYTRNDALEYLEDILYNANFKRIVMSYSNQALVDINELEKLFKKYAVDNKVEIKKISHRKYKNSRSKNTEELNELLISINKKAFPILKSPLNYSGSKDRLMSDIRKFIPANISTFVDAFGGAFNVGLNVNSENVVYNEKNTNTFEIIEMLYFAKEEELIFKIKKIIDDFNLQSSNKETYIKFRDYYNNVEKTPLNLFILSCFCFQNQLRFNKNNGFNTPVGNCAYNEDIENRIRLFKNTLNNNFKLVTLSNLSYNEINPKDYDKNSFFYFDPPYIITKATYNDGKRGEAEWTLHDEENLLNYLNSLHKLGYKFMLSNVITHNGKINELLYCWIKDHNYNIIELNTTRRKEVLITNYKIEGTR